MSGLLAEDSLTLGDKGTPKHALVTFLKHKRAARIKTRRLRGFEAQQRQMRNHAHFKTHDKALHTKLTTD